MKKAIIAFALMMACEDTDKHEICETDNPKYPIVDLYIDYACGDIDTKLILNAVGKLNRLAQENICQKIVNIVGYDVVCHTEIELTGGKLACYYYPQDWYFDNYDGFKGNAVAYKNIRLFMFFEELTSRAARLSLIMHELMHFIGVHGHTKNKLDIMYTSDETKTEYTSGDVEHFCSFYDCEK